MKRSPSSSLPRAHRRQTRRKPWLPLRPARAMQVRVATDVIPPVLFHRRCGPAAGGSGKNGTERRSRAERNRSKKHGAHIFRQYRTSKKYAKLLKCKTGDKKEQDHV